MLDDTKQQLRFLIDDIFRQRRYMDICSLEREEFIQAVVDQLTEALLALATTDQQLVDLSKRLASFEMAALFKTDRFGAKQVN